MIYFFKREVLAMTNTTNINDMTIENPKTKLSNSAAKGSGLDLYKKTLEYKYKDIDISTNDEYKKFYKLLQSQKKKSWSDEYYSYMDKNNHNTNLTLAKILNHLLSIKRIIKEKEHNTSFVPSFASKLLATINPDNPIWYNRILN